MEASRSNVSTYLFLRVILLGSVFVSALFLRWNGVFSYHVAEAVFALCTFSFLMTTGFALQQHIAQDVAYFIPSQVAYDILLTTALIFYTGTNESVYVTFYLINIMFTAVLINGYTALLAAVVCGGLYFMISFFSSDNFSGERSYLMMTTETSFIVVALLAGQLVDELKRNRARIGRLERVSDEIVDSLDAGLVGIDAEQRIVRINRTARLILGLQSGKDYTGADVNEVLKGFQGLSDIGTSEIRDLTINEVHHRYLVSRVKLAEDHVIILFRDLTEVLELEEQVKTQAHLASVGSLAASLAHEIRNPIASISGAAQMLHQTGLKQDEIRRLNSLIVRETERVDLLVAQLLKFARAEASDREQVDVRTLLEECIENLKARPEYADSKVTISLDERLSKDRGAYLNANREQLKEVFSNLLLNAFQALNDMDGPAREKSIAVSFRDRGRDLEVAVKDTGPGIPKEFRSRIFDPFFTTKSYGTGLGLSRVYKIVKEHRGRIDIEGGDAQGTTLRVRLPVSA